MASPNKARGARSLANLKRGGNIPVAKSPEEKALDAEIRKISKAMLLDPAYLDSLKVRLHAGRLQPGVEVALYYYAFGKPREEISLKQPTPIRLVHEYTE